MKRFWKKKNFFLYFVLDGGFFGLFQIFQWEKGKTFRKGRNLGWLNSKIQKFAKERFQVQNGVTDFFRTLVKNRKKINTFLVYQNQSKIKFAKDWLFRIKNILFTFFPIEITPYPVETIAIIFWIGIFSVFIFA